MQAEIRSRLLPEASAVRRVAGYGLFAAALTAAVWHGIQTMRAAAAYRQASLEGIRRAAAIAPRNARYQLALAEAEAQTGGDPLPALHRTLELRTRDSEALIQLALYAENRGETAAAGQYLREAARVNRKYAPRWVLANFYYRRGDQEAFWRWAQEAMRVSYPPRAPLFALAWRMHADADRLLRMSSVRRDAAIELVSWFLDQRLPDAAARTALRLASKANRSESRLFLEVCDRLLGMGSVAHAASIWQTLARGRVLDADAWKEQAGDFVTDGVFARPPLGAGFSWRMPVHPGVESRWEGPGRFVIEFSGRQADGADVLWQWIPPLPPGGRYIIEAHWEAQPSVVNPAGARAGVCWHLEDSAGGGLAAPPVEATPDGAPFRLEFSVSPGNQGYRLTLVHRRQPGARRWEGRIVLRQVRMRKVEPGHERH